MNLLNFYAVLGVSSTEEDVVIRAAYRALMLKHHPDQNSAAASQLEAKAKLINEAYAVLSNSKSRALYDQKLKQKQESTASKRASTEDEAPRPKKPERRLPAPQPRRRRQLTAEPSLNPSGIVHSADGRRLF